MLQIRSKYAVIFLILLSALTAFANTDIVIDCRGPEIFNALICKGDDLSSQEKALFDAVNKYRESNGRPALKLSQPLNLLGNRRMLDLNQNLKVTTHSWSNCPYEIGNEKTWPCLTEAPRRLKTGYTGKGYETLYRTTKTSVDVNAALDAWKKSPLHSSIILNQGMFEELPWEEFGVAIDGQFAALWFGFGGNPTQSQDRGMDGLGISYKDAIRGIGLSMERKSLGSGISTWRGTSPDQKLKIELTGADRDIAEAVLFLSSGGKFDTEQKSILIPLLKNIFPEWSDVEGWLETSVSMIAEKRAAWRSKTIRGIVVELKKEEFDKLRLTIKRSQVRL